MFYFRIDKCSIGALLILLMIMSKVYYKRVSIKVYTLKEQFVSCPAGGRNYGHSGGRKLGRNLAAAGLHVIRPFL